MSAQTAARRARASGAKRAAAAGRAVWEHALRQLGEELPESAFANWIAPLRLMRVDERWVLRAPSRMICDRVRFRYFGRLRATLRAFDAKLAEGLQLELDPAHDAARGGDGHAGETNAHGAAREGGERAGETPPAVRRVAEPPRTAHESRAADAAHRTSTRAAQASRAPCEPHATRESHATREQHAAHEPHAPPEARAAAPAQARHPSARAQTSHAPHGATPSQHARAARETHAPGALDATPQNFLSFVVGPENQFAREAALAVAEGRALAPGPLYLVGARGNGKSHLAQALVREASRLRGVRVLHLRAEAFTNEFQRALHTNQREAFRRRFRRHCQLLVLEDVPFVAGKAATQEELFHTLEELLARGGRAVLTGHARPADIAHLHPGLASLLAGGLVATLDAPSAALRLKILRAKAASGGVRVPDDCALLLAGALTGSVRELLAGLTQVVATANLCGQPLDRALARRVLQQVQPQRAGGLEAADVLRCVCDFFGVSDAQLRSRSRARAVNLPRQVGMYLCHRYTSASFSEIGRHFGRQHSSVRNAVENMDRALLERAPVRYRIEELVQRLGESARPKRADVTGARAKHCALSARCPARASKTPRSPARG